MGAIEVEVKVLNGSKPILFSWENPGKKSIECFLVACSCQNLGLNHNNGKRTKQTTLTSGSQEWASNLAHALEKAEVVTCASLGPLESIANHIGLSQEAYVTYSKEDLKSLPKKDRHKIRKQIKKHKRSHSAKRKNNNMESVAGRLTTAMIPLQDDSGSNMEEDTTIIDEEKEQTWFPREQHIGEDILDIQSESVLNPSDDCSNVVVPDSQVTTGDDDGSIEIDERCAEFDVSNESLLEESQVVTGQGSSQVDVLNESLSQTQIGSEGHYVASTASVQVANTMYFEAVNDVDGRSTHSGATDPSMTSNPLNFVSVAGVVKRQGASEVTATPEIMNNSVQLVDIESTVVVSSAFSNSGSSSLTDEQTLMKAIDSIMDMCPESEMVESPVLPETMYTLPAKIISDVPRTKVPFIRNLTEEERKIMFKFQSDIEKKNQVALESGGGFLCEQCGKIFYARRNLKKHVQIHESDRERSLICDVCGKGFYSKNGLKNHLQIHDVETQYTCRYCPKSYKSVFGRTIHERLHFAVYPETCSKCGRKFKSNRELKKHLASGHCDGTAKTKRKPKIRGYTRKPSVPMKHGQMGSTTCNMCNKVLRTSSFPAHLVTHEGKMFTCPMCNKVMAFSTRYYHLKWHENCKDHKCNVCGKDFRTKQGLKAHVRVHTGERPIKCRYCDRMFSRYSSREVHEVTHTGERPFKCTICDKTWKDRSSYWLHMKKNHPGEPLFYRRLSAQINSKRQEAQGMELPEMTVV